MSEVTNVGMADKTAAPSSGARLEHVVCKVGELPPGSRKIVQVRNRQIGVYNVNGRYYALHSMCPHQFGPLCHGPVGGEMVCEARTNWRFEWTRNGEILTCPWHGMEFDITTGQSLTMRDVQVRSYEVRVVDDEIRIQLGLSKGGAQPTRAAAATTG